MQIKYVKAGAAIRSQSHLKTGKRNWPIADRSSMGLAFEDLKPWQEHRRVVPVTHERMILFKSFLTLPYRAFR